MKNEIKVKPGGSVTHVVLCDSPLVKLSLRSFVFQMKSDKSQAISSKFQANIALLISKICTKQVFYYHFQSVGSATWCGNIRKLEPKDLAQISLHV